MEANTGLVLGAILVGGAISLWLASLLKIPAVIPLLLTGLLLGPVTEVLDPLELFGDSFYPAVSIAVALLLFDGGLSLRRERLEHLGVVVRFITVGALVTATVGSIAAVALLDVPVVVAVLIGCIVVVSGPTVVGPILQNVSAREPAATVLRWEGITIDPVGATLAVLVLNVAMLESFAAADIAREALLTVLVGVVAGAVGAVLLVGGLHRNLIPHRLHVPVAIGLVVAAYEAAEHVEPEAGLFAATVMGVVAANQRRVPVHHIVDFGESLGQLLISVLFVTLAASLDAEQFSGLVVPALGLCAVLVLVARPLTVLVSTFASNVPRRQRVFMAWMAPRGIVAASTASLFTVTLVDGGVDGSALAPVTFVVITTTVVLYGLTARPVARLLGVVAPPGRGLLIVGTPEWAMGLAEALSRHDVPVAFLATDATSARAATDRGYEVLSRGVSGDDLSDALSGSQVGQVLAVDDNDAFNELILDRLVSHLDHDALYRLAPEAATDPGRGQAGLGRSPFEGIADQHEIASRMALGWSITETSAGAVPGEASLLVAIDAGTVRFRPRREVLDVSAAVVALTPP